MNIQQEQPVERGNDPGITWEGLREREKVTRNPDRRALKTRHEQRRRQLNPELRQRERIARQRYRDDHPRPFVGVDGEGGNTGPCRACMTFWHAFGKPERACRAFEDDSSRQCSDECPNIEHRHCACGCADAEHQHQYWLLRAGNRVLETGQPLTWQECLGFLADLDPEPLYVGFYFGYDTWQIVNHLPAYKLRRLADRESRVPKMKGRDVYPVDLATGPCTEAACDCADYTYDESEWCKCEHADRDHAERFEIDYLPNNFFKVHRPGQQWIEISDVGSFFQASFLTALQQWSIGTDEEREQIAIGKGQRGNFGNPDDEMRAYNALEIRLLEALMEEFRRVLRDSGLPSPRKWQGPGKVAEALMVRHQIPKNYELPFWENVRFKLAANATYVGGRFETSMIGSVPNRVWIADINSAYPKALTEAPCLIHGEWVYGSTPASDLYIAQGTFESSEEAFFYGLPVRNATGGISYPERGAGWYWSFEIEASIHQQFTIRECWSYLRHCDCQPFNWIPELYEQRLRVGKSARGKALKLALNSLYGKLCQRVGAALYNNLVWSSFITAHCRTQLQRFVHSLPACQNSSGINAFPGSTGDEYRKGVARRRCGDTVYKLATDGVCTSELPDGFTESKALGEWAIDVEHPEGIFIVQPGLDYGSAVDSAGERVKPKTRGINLNRALEYEEAFRQALTRLVRSGKLEDGMVEIPMMQCISLRLGLHMNRLDLVGQWLIRPRVFSFDWTPKRDPTTWPSMQLIRMFNERGEPPGWRQQPLVREQYLYFPWKDPAQAYVDAIWGGDQDSRWIRTYPPDGSTSVASVPYSKRLAAFLDRSRLDDGIDEASDQPDFLPFLAHPLEQL